MVYGKIIQNTAPGFVSLVSSSPRPLRDSLEMFEDRKCTHSWLTMSSQVLDVCLLSKKKIGNVRWVSCPSRKRLLLVILVLASVIAFTTLTRVHHGAVALFANPGLKTELQVKIGRRSSSFSCFEGRYCSFQNLCLSKTGRWNFFSGFSHVADSTFDEVELSVSPQKPGRRAEIEIISGHIPDSFSTSVRSLAEMDLYHARNRGHVLGDNVFALFQAAKLSETPLKDVQMIVNHVTQANQMFKLVTFHEPILKSALPTDTCFSNVLLGFRGLGYVKNHRLSLTDPDEPLPHQKLVFRGKQLMDFRQVVLSHLEVRPETRSKGHKVHITIIEKDLHAAEHKSAISNVREISQAISSRYGEDDISLSVVCWEGMPLRDQVAHMSNTDVLLSLPGSDVMNAVFMPAISAMILPHRFVSGNWEKSNEVRLWFKHIPERYIDEYMPQPTGWNGEEVFPLDINQTLSHLDAAMWYIQSNRFAELYVV